VHVYTKFQVSNSTRFEYTLGCAPKIMGSRDLGHASFLDFSLRFWRYCHSASVYQISTLYLYSFSRHVRVYAKNYGGPLT